ncbi:hypothetical protein EGW08_020184, partial [Elysia chlorotica]
MSDSNEENPIETELEALEAIYISELSYMRKADGTLDTIELVLHPSTGDELDKQFVCMTVVFTPTPKYPDEIPAIDIKNPRGLGEEEVASLVEDMISKAHECVGEVMLFTLIEMAKDCLTEGNVPHCPCVLCLEHFREDDQFHRTACYHYFHNSCLWRYLEHSRMKIAEEIQEENDMRHREMSEEKKVKVIECPVCRSPLGEESLSVKTDCEEDQPEEDGPAFVISPAMKEQQAKMAKQFARQKAKGGIIDLEQEKNKYLVNLEDRAPAASISPIKLSSQNLPEVPIDKCAKDLNAHHKKNPDIDFRRSNKQRQDGSRGHGRGHNSYHRERNDDNHQHHSRNYHHHYHHQGRGHRNHHRERNDASYHKERNDDNHDHHHQPVPDHGKGRARYRTSNHCDTDPCVGRDNSKHREEDVPPQNGTSRNTRSIREQGRGQDSADSNNTITNLPPRVSGLLEEVRPRLDGPDSNSQHWDRQNSQGSFSEQQSKEGTRRRGRGGFGGRSRGRGGSLFGPPKVGRPNSNCEREAFQEDSSENRTGLNHPADRDTQSETDKGQRNNQRRRGRGRFRDFERAYFEGHTEPTDRPGNRNKPPESRRESGARGRGGGCREPHKRNPHKDNEYDDHEDGSRSYSNRSAGTGRSERLGHGKSAGSNEVKDGSDRSVSQDTVSGDHHRLQGGDWQERDPYRDGDTCDETHRKIEEELEMNRRWRKLNFGFDASDGKHGTSGCSKAVNGEHNDTDINVKGCEQSRPYEFEGHGVASNIDHSAPDNLSHIYVGYDEEGEEEEDWEQERFQYAFERRHIRTENLEEYDKYRSKDYESYRKKVEERSNRERLLREEDRRMRREQAESERRLASSVNPEPTKSVLELFQEKQEAKRKEAERLKQEQRAGGDKSEKSVTELSSDGGFHSDGAADSETTPVPSRSTSTSSQGYQSQSSTEEISGHDLQVPGDGSRRRSEAISLSTQSQSKSETQNDKKDKLTAASCDMSSEILWVGVKQKPNIEPSDLTGDIHVDADPDVIRPGLDDPCLDAWERREERKRAKNKKAKTRKSKVDGGAVVDTTVAKYKTETEDANGVCELSTMPTETLDNNLENTKGTKTLSTFGGPSRFNESNSDTGVKQRTLTKAPPLKLSLKTKQKDSMAPQNSLADVGLYSLTKDEVALLKAKYMETEETGGCRSAAWGQEVYSVKGNCGGESRNETVSSDGCGNLDKTEFADGNSQQEKNVLTSQLALSSVPRTSLRKPSEMAPLTKASETGKGDNPQPPNKAL